MLYYAEALFAGSSAADKTKARHVLDELLKNDQATKHFEQAIKRLFAIGRYWLDAPKPASEIV